MRERLPVEHMEYYGAKQAIAGNIRIALKNLEQVKSGGGNWSLLISDAARRFAEAVRLSASLGSNDYDPYQQLGHYSGQPVDRLKGIALAVGKELSFYPGVRQRLHI